MPNIGDRLPASVLVGKSGWDLALENLQSQITAAKVLEAKVATSIVARDSLGRFTKKRA